MRERRVGGNQELGFEGKIVGALSGLLSWHASSRMALGAGF